MLEHVAHGQILRIYIDHEGGVSLDHCSEVSRLVGDLLDAEGMVEGAGGISGAYTLEVSSPGLDRPLVRPQDFERFAGRQVHLSTRTALVDAMNPTGRKKFHGKLVAAGEASVELDVDGHIYTLLYSAIDKARLVPEF